MAERTSRHRYSPEVTNLRYPAFGAYCDCLDWQIGHELSRRRGEWGLGVIGRASQDLRAAFPDMQGFSPTNLKYMRAFAEAWPDFEDRQRTVGELPWGHNVTLVTWLESEADRVAYAQAALTHGWSRTVLDHHIDLRTVDRLGKAQTNFESTLPSVCAPKRPQP